MQVGKNGEKGKGEEEVGVESVVGGILVCECMDEGFLL